MCKDNRVAVVEQVHVLQGQQEIAEGLHRHIDALVVGHQVDAVGAGIHHQRIAVARVGTPGAAEEGYFLVRMGAVRLQNVDQRAVRLEADESVVIEEGDHVLFAIDGHGVGVAVRPRQDADLAILGIAQTVLEFLTALVDVLFQYVGIQLGPLLQRDVGHIGIADKVHGHGAGVVNRAEIEGHVLRLNVGRKSGGRLFIEA